MAKSDTSTERVRKWREKQKAKRAELAREGIGIIKVRTPGQHQETFIRTAEEAISLYLGEPVNFDDLDFWERENELKESFLRSGGPTKVEFSDPELGSALVNVLPYNRAIPNLMMYKMRDGTRGKIENWREAFGERFPIVAEINQLGNEPYDWETPKYRELCLQLGMNPDYNRPQFEMSHQTLGESLVKWSIDNLSKVQHGENELFQYHELKPYVLDFIDFIRTDGDIAAPASIYQMRDKFEKLKGQLEQVGLPHVSEMAKILENPPQRPDAVGLDGAVIEFLPSEQDAGYRASIYSRRDTSDEDGWDQQGYGHLWGIAVEPESDRSWLKVVVERLKRNGVIFLTPEDAKRYMQGEGRYWLWRFNCVQVPYWQALLWSIKKPETPLSDKAKLRRRAAQILNEDEAG